MPQDSKKLSEEELDIFKKHIKFEEGMDESMLSFYLSMGKKYVFNATGKANSDLNYLVAGIFFEFMIPEEEMEKAFSAMTPLFVQESAVKDDG